MRFDQTVIQSAIEGLHLTGDILVSEIPNIELYMDQLLEFLNRRLAPAKRDALDKGLTKTMINNYTKDQLLIPPVNKKYGTYHIMLLILICQLKSVLSISDIKKLFAPILNDVAIPDDDMIPLEEIYNSFLDLKHQQFREFQEGIFDKVKHIECRVSSANIEQPEAAQLFLTILVLAAQANASKRLAEKLIDLYFTDSG